MVVDHGRHMMWKAWKFDARALNETGAELTYDLYISEVECIHTDCLLRARAAQCELRRALGTNKSRSPSGSGRRALDQYVVLALRQQTQLLYTLAIIELVRND